VKCVVSQVGDLNSRWGWLNAMKAVVAEYPKAEGTPAELAAAYDEVFQRMAQRSGRIESLLAEERITLGADGLLSVARGAEVEPGVVSLLEEQNSDLKTFFSVLANFPERADEIFLIQRSYRARGLIGPFPQGVGYGTLPPMSGIADLTQMVEYAAVDSADEVNAPVLIIEAGAEELMDPAYGTGLLAEKLEARGVPVKREVFEGVSHFEIYRPPALQRARTLALDWFNRYLKGDEQNAERAAVQRTMEAMSTAYAARDIDAYMSYISEDFESRHYFDKEGFRAYLEQAWQELVWQSTYDPAAIVVEGDTAHAISTSISGMGRFTVRTNFEKEDDGVWRVVSY
jgi:hypothetical protein